MANEKIPEGKQLKIRTSEIHPNPENPRIIFDPTGMAELKESIRQVGILVPLIVYQKEGTIFLLDGERRWRCAKDLGMEEVPVNVISPPPPALENLLRMFNIHQLREQWNIIETAWKLEKIIRLSGVDSERRLSELTGITISQIRRLKIILTFDRRYQEKIYDYLMKTGKGVKSDFLIEMFPVIRKLEKEYPEFYNEHRYKLMDSLLDKYESGVIKNVTDFRLFKRVLKSYEEISLHRFESQLLEFINTPNQSIQDLYRKTSMTYHEVESIITLSMTLSQFVNNLSNIKSIRNKAELRSRLQELSNGIDELLKKLD